MTAGPSAGDGQEQVDDWGPDLHARLQREAWRRTSPAQRLAWLESALRFAHAAGALPRAEEPGEAQPRLS